MKFYKRDPDRALSGMAELTLKQRGGYNSLLDLLYSRDGDVPDDDVRVARMICCHWREWGAVKRELMACGKVWEENGKLHARRVQETIKDAADFSQEQSRRASEGWNKRKSLSDNNDDMMPAGNATHTHTHSQNKKEVSSSGSARAKEDFSNFVVGRKNGVGKKEGGSEGVTLQDPDERIVRFMQSLAREIPDPGWVVIGTATDPDALDHDRCVSVCKDAAGRLGKGWPRNWPTDHKIFDRLVLGKTK